MTVRPDDGESPDPMSDDEPQGCQTVTCSNCGDEFEPCNVGTFLRFPPAAFRGDRLPGHAIMVGDVGARNKQWQCAICTRGYHWLFRRYGHTGISSSAMIKLCGTARTRVMAELEEKVCPDKSLLGREHSARRMKELCPWLVELEATVGAQARTQRADYTAPALAETRAERRSRLHAKRVARLGPVAVDETKFAAARASKCRTHLYPASHAAAAAILYTTGTSGLPHSVLSRVTRRRTS
jgi:hypothetical protein